MSTDKPPGRDPIEEALLAVTGELEAAGVHYALIGGLAAAEHGVIRATQDVDLLLTVPAVSLPGLLEALQEAGCRVDTDRVIREWTRDHLTRIYFGSVPIDWLAPVIPLFQVVLDRAAVRRMLGRPVRVADAEGTVLMKLVAFRPEDRHDVEAIAAASPGLDWAFVRRELEQVFESDDERMAWLDSIAPGTSE
jgi:hypothetical protein